MLSNKLDLNQETRFTIIRYLWSVINWGKNWVVSKGVFTHPISERDFAVS